MFNVLKMSFKIDIAYATNAFIYTIKKLPILKDLFSDDLYSSSGLKKFVSVLGIILTSCRLLLYRLLYFFVIYMIASAIRTDNLNLSFIHVYIVFALIGLIINTNLLSVSSKKYFSVVLFQMDAKKYMQCDFIWGLILSFVLNLIGFLFISMFINISLLLIIGLCLFSLLCKIVGEAISIAFYRNHGYLLTSKYSFTFGYVISLLLIACLPIIGLNISKILFIFALIIMIILAIISFIYVMRVKDYKLIYKKLNTAKLAMNEKNSEAYNRQAMVAIKEKDKIINSDKVKNKKGYDLFNTIFFERHKEILLRSAKTFSLVSAAVIIGLIVMAILTDEVSNVVSNMLHNQLGWFVIIMYFINRGAIVTQAMFYNCDHAMLAYNFYREPKVLLGLFKKRLIMLIKVNLIPAIVIASGVVFLLYFSGGTLMINYIMIPLFIILLSVFFSVHYLVIYYLLQPFNKNLEMKKASYSIVSFITYFVSYTITDFNISSLIFSISGLIFTVLYIVISLYLVYRFAPRTFKINN